METTWVAARCWWWGTMITRAIVCLVVTLLSFWVSAPVAFAAETAPSASVAPAPAPRHHRSDLDDELPPDVREKLTPDQLQLILMERSKRPAAPGGAMGNNVEIIVPLAFFALIIGVIAAALYANYRRDRQRHETLRLAIERGADIPPALLVNAPSPRSDLKRGTLLLAAGLALGILLLATDAGKGVWTSALIPTFLGLGYLIVYRFEQKKSGG